MTDHQILITASRVLAIVALVLIFTLWADPRIYAKYPRLLTAAVGCMVGAVVAAIVAEVVV